MIENKRFKQTLFVFKIYNLIYLLLAFNAFVNGMSAMKYATMLSAIWGVGLGFWMLIGFKRYMKVPNIYILLAFMISAVFSTIMNLSYGWMENVQGLIWLGISMIVIYVPTCAYSKKEILKELKVLSYIAVIYCTVMHVISITMIFWSREKTYKDPQGDTHLVGFNWGRLWGIYDEPNRGAVIALIAMFLGIYLLILAKKKREKIFWGMSMFVQYLFIVLSDSRTGQLALAVGLFTLTGIYTFMKREGKKYKVITALILGVCVALLSLGVTMGTKKVYNVVDVQITKQLEKTNGHSIVDKPADTKIGRKADLQDDVSNGRLDIWESGLEVFQASPLYGVSFRNMVPFAKDKFPDTYIVNNALNIKYDSLHSMPMDVIVSQGIIGVGLLVLLICNTLRYMKQKIKNLEKEEYIPALIMFVVLIAISASSTVLSTIFYLNSPETLWFWLCYAYLIGLLKVEQEEQII